MVSTLSYVFIEHLETGKNHNLPLKNFSRQRLIKESFLKRCLSSSRGCFVVLLQQSKCYTTLLIILCAFSFRSNRLPANALQAGDVVRRCGLCHELDMVLRQKPVISFIGLKTPFWIASEVILFVMIFWLAILL